MLRHLSSQVYWHVPVILALGRARQEEGHKLEDSLSYAVHLRTA